MVMENSNFIIELCESHIHLSKKDFKTLFGENAKLEVEKFLSQPGLFMSKQQIEVEGATGKSIILPVHGPLRARTQVEISDEEAAVLGVDAKKQVSGSRGSGIVILRSELNSISSEGSVIIPASHLHMPPEDASPYNLENLQKVSVQLDNKDDVILKDVTVRISHMYVARLHISKQEAKKYGITDADQCRLIL